MARKADHRQTRELYREIKGNPGQRKGFFTQLLGWHRQKVARCLVHAEDEGLLLYEDDDGNLWPYENG